MAAPEEIEAAARAPCVAVSHGNVAFFVGKGRLASNPDHTHKWTVFVRGAYGQDISYAVEKVVFSLHPSFADHIRGACGGERGGGGCSRSRWWDGCVALPTHTPHHLRSHLGAAVPGV